MAQKKAGEVDAFLSRPDTSFPVVLLYGPDPGLVAERSERVIGLSGVDRNDPFAAVTLAAEDIEKDPGRLIDEARTISMFGGRRLVRVRGAGAGKSLAEAIADLSADPPPDTTIVVEAGDLKKSAALRGLVERSRYGMALPCYQDEGRAVDRMIDEELALAGLTLEREARDELRSRLGADRLASRGEVRKLCLYAFGQTMITEGDVRAVVGDVSADTVDEVVDAVVGGEVKRLPHLIARLTAAGTSTHQLHQALLKYLQQLQAMREAVERHGEPVSRAVERRRPHFRRKAAMQNALQAWPLDAITDALGRIERDILASRKQSDLAETITRSTLFGIAVEAARLRANR